MRSWLLIAFLLTACIKDALVPCNGELCPAGSLCAPSGCVLQGQLDACKDVPDQTPCQVLDLPPGLCIGGVCHVPNCGNGFIDAPIEQCDDGNHIAGDGCSADCLSNETCGNNVVDAVRGEQCDTGIYGLSGDGCTSGCRAEFEIWRDITPAQLSARSRFRMVYDAARHQIVGFGGFSGSEPLGDTWVYEQGRWSQKFPQSSPEPRYGHTMVYDAARGVVVLFGGTDGITFHQSIWEWDGTSWTKRTFTPEPAPRSEAAMAYDADAHQIVLYGGQGAFVDGDTWTFDGTAWTLRALTQTPGSYLGGTPFFNTMFYDALDHRIYLLAGQASDADGSVFVWSPQTPSWDFVIPAPGSSGFQDPLIVSPLGSHALWFSGRTNAGTLDAKLYEWNSLGDQTWVPLAAIGTPPSARWRASGAVDETDHLVVFGGLDSLGHPLRDTSNRPVTGWVAIPTTPTPLGRAGAGASYAVDDGEVAMFGGTIATDVNDLWLWNEPGWTTGATSGPRRQHVAMTYDEDRGESVLFGGASCDASGSGSGGGSGSGSGSSGGSNSTEEGCPSTTTYYSEMYTLHHRTWQPHVVARPPARGSAAIAYDTDHHVAVMFGGDHGQGLAFADTWTWNGSAWSPLAPLARPPAMTGARMIYDRAHATIVMYGGTGDLGSVWMFDGSTWTDVTPASGPTPRHRPVFVYDARRERGVLFGGMLASGQLVADTWEWDTATLSWTQRSPAQSPPLRADASAVYDAAQSHITMFGGRGIGGAVLDDVWGFAFVASAEQREACDGTDADGDGLVGCADPDCWARCTPHCPPGAACDPAQPHCGDGTCSTVETHALCPQDCL